MGLGAFIGIEREITGRPAGLRTHMLVAGVAALLVGLGDVLIQSFETQVSESPLQSDPIRIIKAVITGVSFLGAGTIIRSTVPELTKPSGPGTGQAYGLPLQRPLTTHDLLTITATSSSQHLRSSAQAAT
jgi:hypothetical protein